LVGPEKKEFKVSAIAISSLSKALKTLINGPHMEATQTRVVQFDDVDEVTFSLFCQFAYTGNYSTPKPDIIKPPEVEQVKEPEELSSETKKKKKKKTSIEVWGFDEEDRENDGTGATPKDDRAMANK
jgi:hypothetical protein